MGEHGPTIGVHAPWHATHGPVLALGMLTAAARAWRNGALLDRFTIERPHEAGSVLARLERRGHPAVVLCSNYLWTVEDNLHLARRAVALAPRTVTIHGGPSTPGYEAEAEAFLREHGEAARILVHGEGEDCLAELLDALGDGFPEIDDERLARVPGISFLDADGRYVRTGKRPRIDDLDALPSPLLTGEFDHIATSAWRRGFYLETNRGCPYRCTFCDWGSLTMSRIRQFDLERVKAELDWATERGFTTISFTDANFGIVRRDTEIVDHVVERHRDTGCPTRLAFAPAKNNVTHLTRIIRALRSTPIEVDFYIGLQSTDPATLQAIERSNISIDRLLDLATELRRHDEYVVCEFILGLPGQTVESFRRDLQFASDHGMMPRVHLATVLPNSQMNDPRYRREHDIEVDEDGFVRSCSTFSERDRDRMLRLLRAWAVLEHQGLLRHVLHHVQWDHGVEVSQVLLHIADTTAEDPDAAPRLAALIDDFLDRPSPPSTWEPLHDEVRDLLVNRFNVPDDAALDVAFRVQAAVSPTNGRRFPETVHLEHDYVAYHRSALRSLFGPTGRTVPARPLRDHPPGNLEVIADPLELCSRPPEAGPRAGGRNAIAGEEVLLMLLGCYELLSPLRSSWAARRFRLHRPDLAITVDDTFLLAGEAATDRADGPVSVPVALRPRSA